MTLPDIGAWADLPFFATRWPAIEAALSADPRTILPPENTRFAALRLTQPEDTRVVILGQDPYPTPGHANGLAFSVAPGVALPASLKNIFRELEDDIGARPANGDLSPWAEQGVLLLNTVLTVPSGVKNGHKNLGWQALTTEVLSHLDETPRAFLLWGKPAQNAARHLSSHHLKIETYHPSPLSAHQKKADFFGSRPFSRINAWLEARGEAPIRWA